ncbi:diacylglycerol kinase family protein [Propionibacteriaceae bacterium Y1700]|uniref:diacylglycerol kinase family protein n=1 Tax=Microlunatus sp. Y1700 TaxID=3418487 RepID=UPI003DA6FC70
MVRRPPSRSALSITTALVLAFGVWTAATVGTDWMKPFDRHLLAPPVQPLSWLGQVLATVAMITHPVVVYVALLATAWWSNRRRLRNLAVALALAVVIGGSSTFVLRRLLAIPRPEQKMEAITGTSFAYPSGHVTAATIAVIMVGATLTSTREPRRVRRLWMLGGAGIILLVAVDRWLMSAHWFSDIVGGLLLGAAVAAVSLIIADVRILPRSWRDLAWMPTPAPIPAEVEKRCAVIYNPSKVQDWVTFRRHVEYELAKRSYSRTLWLETTVDDPGREMAAKAVRKEVDLVIGAGGDGTIRAVTSALAGTGIPFGLIPAGTGNLLAKNLGVPLDEREALAVAFEGTPSAIDLVRVTADDRPADHFAVMAGIGIDAVIMDSTDVNLKRAVGSAAYFVAAAQNVNHPPIPASITIDDERELKRKALVMVVGNVGYLQANIPLIPDARADDGLLDLLVAAPDTWRQKVSLVAKVLTRRDRQAGGLDRVTASKVVIEVEDEQQFQLDGDNVGLVRRLECEVVPGALTIMLRS